MELDIAVIVQENVLMKKKLTTQCVNSLKPKEKVYKVWDTQIPSYHVRVMPSGLVSFAIFYRVNGKGKDYTIGKLGRYTATTARDEAVRLMADLSRGVDIQASKKETQKRAASEKYENLRGFIDEMYGPWALVEQKRGDETLKLLKFSFEAIYTKKLQEISVRDIQDWRKKKLKQGLAPSTLNRRVTALKSVLSKAVEWEVISENPLSRFKPLKLDDAARVRYLTDEEETRLKNALDIRESEIREKRRTANEWRLKRGLEPKSNLEEMQYADYLKPMVLLALNTGLRRGELFDLKWCDLALSPDNPLLTVEGLTSKTGQTRHVPLNDEALSVCLCWNARESSGTQLVFPNPKTGQRFNNIKTSWSSLIERAEIENFRFHDLRHSFASKLVMKGVSLYVVQSLLGHSSIEMTQRYAHLAPDTKLDAVQSLIR